MGETGDEQTLPIMPGPVPPDGALVESPPIVLTVPNDKVVVVTRHTDEPTTVEIVIHQSQSLVINGTEVTP